MKYIFQICLAFVVATMLAGCIVVEKRSYVINLNNDNSGTATVTFQDIRSNAIGNKEFDQDVINLIDTYQGEDFILYWKEDGITILNRELYVEDDILSGKVTFKFEDITNIEGIRFDNDFYYLSYLAQDSVSATNGQRIDSGEYKRILWDKGTKTLEFTYFDDMEYQTKDMISAVQDVLK